MSTQWDFFVRKVKCDIVQLLLFEGAVLDFSVVFAWSFYDVTVIALAPELDTAS